MTRKFLSPILLLGILFIISCGSCERKSNGGYLSRDDWNPVVKTGINDFIDTYRNTKDAYVVFDFDNTTSVFDVEYQLTAYQLQTMTFAMTPDRFRTVICHGMDSLKANDWAVDIAIAYDSLYASYGPFTGNSLNDDAVTRVQSDKWWKEFATKMRYIIENDDDFFTESGNVDDWLHGWFTGMTPEEVYRMAYQSHSKNSKVVTSKVKWESPAEIKSHVGLVSVEWTSGIQVTENLKELYRTLSSNGIDVWICSASSKEVVKAAVDYFGLRDYVKGITAMTLEVGPDSCYTGAYDYQGTGASPVADGWKDGTHVIGCKTAGAGKVTAIQQAIAPLYHGATPLAGFMDSTGDFNFCTEFESLSLVVCFNRADRKITDGGGLIAEIAMYEQDSLKYDFRRANAAGDTYYVLQGRDENEYRSLRASDKTIRLGQTTGKLFAGDANYQQLSEMEVNHLSVAAAINKYASLFLSDYAGYHSK